MIEAPREPAWRRAMVMVTLVLTGECVYLLVYILRRDFGSAIVEALGISNTQLGTLSAAFGVLALLCYFPGGFIADRYPARDLMMLSSVLTAIGGFVFSAYPPYGWVVMIFALWGISTILTFWAALVKVTRAWGGVHQQGRAFGFLDGGRALVAALAGSIGIAIFSTQAESAEGLRLVIFFYSGLCVACAVLVYFFITDAYDTGGPESSLDGLRYVLKMPVTWWQAMVIFCAYAAFWGTFNLSSFASAGFGMDHTEAAWVSVIGAWCGPVVAISAGFIAEKVGAARAVTFSFWTLAASFFMLAAITPGKETETILWIGAIASSASAFALRGLYFSLLDEGGVPVALTGTTVGVVSILGYTPDIIVPPLSGTLVDNLPDADGYRVLFALLAVGCLAGIFATSRLRRLSRMGETG